MFRVSGVAEAVVTRKDRFVKKYVLNSSVVCEICAICSFTFSFHFSSIFILCATDFGE